MSAAEEGLLSGIRVQRTGSAYRGGPIRYKPQMLSRVQDGKYGLDTNQTYRRIRLKAAHKTATGSYMGSIGEQQSKQGCTNNSKDISK